VGARQIFARGFLSEGKAEKMEERKPGKQEDERRPRKALARVE
jgi:hypothetical protein